MTYPSARPKLPTSHRALDFGSSKPAPETVEAAHELTNSGLARSFFGPEVRSWRGEQPLWMAFWGYGVLGSVSLAILYAVSIYLDRVGLQQALLLCIAGYTFWVLVSLWRSSKPEVNTLWGTLARHLAVAWALNVILALTFLQLGLVAKYLDVPSALAAGRSTPPDVNVHDHRSRIRGLLKGEHESRGYIDSEAS